MSADATRSACAGSDADAEASPRFVWFDFGGVLSPPLSELYASYEKKTGIPPHVLQQAIKTVGEAYAMEPLAPLELALVDERTWVDRLHAAIDRTYPDIDLSRSHSDFGRQWFAGHEVNGRVRDAVISLAARGLRVGVLSNNVVEWEQSWRSMIDLDEYLVDVVDSSRVGIRKPDPAIFDLAASRNGVRPQDCILVDDLAENCLAAERQGWAAVHFTDTEAALQRVHELTQPPRDEPDRIAAPGALPEVHDHGTY